MYSFTGPREFERPSLLLAFDGWVDAAGVGTKTAEFLAADSPVVAAFDPDSVYDYRVNRPVADFVDGRLSETRWPELTVRHRRLQGRDLLVMTGPEPDLHWHAFGQSMVDLAAETEAAELIMVGSVPAAVPHTMPVTVLNTSTHLDFAELGEQVPEGLLRVPAAAVTIVEHYLSEEGLPTVGFWAHIPHYVTTPYHQGVVALVRRVGRYLDLDIPMGGLLEQAATQLAELDRIVEAQPDVKAHLERLQSLAGQDPLPTGDEIASQIEEFLRSSGPDD